jgi:hypothetical protein
LRSRRLVADGWRTGVVTELVPGSDPQQPPVTRLTSPSGITQLSPGQPFRLRFR